MLYLDNAAATKMHKEVLQEMLKALNSYGNSEAKFYSQAEEAKNLITIARNRVASLINADSDEIIFTSGATESNNLVLKGLFFASNSKKKIIISAIEHSSVYDTCMFLKKMGASIEIIPVDKSGKIDLDSLESKIDNNTLLVSIISVNNEIGTVQDLEKIDEICFKHKVFLHTDATQAAGKIELNIRNFKSLKFLTFTAHKIYGPKGIGCLVIKASKNEERPELIPLFHGGEQEFGLRAGTSPISLIVGFGKACEIAKRDFKKNHEILLQYEKIVLDKLKHKFNEKMIINNDFEGRIPGLLNIRFIGYNNMVFLKAISSEIAASTGSACAVSKPSRILANIGLSETEINESIRISLSPYEAIEQLDTLDKI